MALYNSNLPELLYPGMRGIWGLSYKDYKPEWKAVFPVLPSKQAYEKTMGMTGFPLATLKPQGKGVDYFDPLQGPTHNLYHYVRGIGFVVTKEMMTDDQYGKIKILPKALRRSMNQTKEWDHWNVLNNAFDYTNYKGADGYSLCYTAHPLYGSGGTIGNQPSTAADLSMTALEQASIDIDSFVDDQGLKIHVKIKKLVVAKSNDWTAYQLTKAENDPETPASNAPNPVRGTGMFPEGYMVSHYLTSPKAWFILTDQDMSLVSYYHTDWGQEPDFTKDNEFSTLNALFKAVDRYVAGWDDWRGIYGSPGT
jgi:hypothetical protein